MAYTNDEEMYKDATNVLKGLPQVNAPANFEADLMRRINSEKFGTEEPKRESFWERFLLPSRLVPSAALAVAAVFLLFFFNTSSVEQDDPLSLEPRVREDMIVSDGGNAGISVDEEMQNIERQNRENLMRRESFQGMPDSEEGAAASFASTASISKSGLNFRQVNLTPEQKKELSKLKDKIKEYLQEVQGQAPPNETAGN